MTSTLPAGLASLTALAPWARRVVAVGIALVLCVVLAMVILPSFRSLVASQERWREQAGATLAADRAEVAREPQIRAQLRRLGSDDQRRAFYNPAGGMTAEARVQADVASLVSRSGATVITVASLPSREVLGLRQFGVRVMASMHIDQLRQILATARSNERFLRVDRLAVSAPMSPAPTENPVLQIVLEVVGYGRLAPAGT